MDSCECDYCRQRYDVLSFKKALVKQESPSESKKERPQRMEKKGMILTITEIKDLAEFAGLTIAGRSKSDTDDDDAEISIEDCPAPGVKGDDGIAKHYAHIAFLTDSPEEGCMPLGKEKKGG